MCSARALAGSGRPMVGRCDERCGVKNSSRRPFEGLTFVPGRANVEIRLSEMQPNLEWSECPQPVLG